MNEQSAESSSANAGAASSVKKLSIKTLETFVLRTAAQVASTLMGIAIARLLGPGAKGLFAYATAAAGILATIASGQSVAISYEYGKQKTASAPVFRTMMRYMAAVIIPLSVATVVASLLRNQPPLMAAGLMFPFAYFNSMAMAFYLADGDVRWTNVQGFLIATMQLIAVAAAAYVARDDLRVIFGAWIVPQVVMAIVTYVKLRPYAHRDDRSIDERALFWRQFALSLKSSVTRVIWALNFQIDIFVILWLLGSRAVGIYSVAVGIGQLLWFISQPLAITTWGAVTTGSKDESATLTAACVRHVLSAVLLACIVLYFAGPPLIQLIYGARFGAAGTALRFILPGTVAYCAVPFLGQFFFLQLGSPTPMTIIGAISTLICAAVTVALAPHLGIVAGSIGTSVSYVASFGIAVWLFRRTTNIPLRQLFIPTATDARIYMSLMRSVFSKLSRIVHPIAA